MTEVNDQQAAINEAVAGAEASLATLQTHADKLTGEVQALTAAQATGQPLDLTGLQTLAAEMSRDAVNAAAADADAPVDDSTTSVSSTIDTGTGSPAQESVLTPPSVIAGSVDQAAATAPGVGVDGSAASLSPVTGPTGVDQPVATVSGDANVTPQVLPLYRFAGSDESSIDSSEWTDSGLVAANGEKLYTFAGDTAGGAPSGSGADWIVDSSAPAEAVAPADTDGTAPSS